MHAGAADDLGQLDDLLALAERVPEHRDRAELERRGARARSGASGAGSARRGTSASRSPCAGPRSRAASRPPARRRARCTGTRRSRSAPGRSGTSTTSSAPSSSRSRCGGSRSRRDAGDRLAVEVDDQPEHAVRGRVVRAEVDVRMSSSSCFAGRPGARSGSGSGSACPRRSSCCGTTATTPPPRSAPARRRSGSPSGAGARPSRPPSGCGRGSG